MDKACRKLIALGELMRRKYGGVDASTIKGDIHKSIWTAIRNASYGKLGIMPFMNMLQQDQAAMNINVTRNGNDITVSAPALDKAEVAGKYQALPTQIKNYLDRYIEVFPSMKNGEPIDYNNFTITLEYLSDITPRPEIAKR